MLIAEKKGPQRQLGAFQARRSLPPRTALRQLFKGNRTGSSASTTRVPFVRLLGEKQFNGFGQFLAQVGEEGRRDDDPDWYEPLIDPRGVIHCVRVPLAGHRRPKGAHGLVPAHKSPNRYGANGASPHARKAINVTARCLNRFSKRVAFGAFTPSPVDMDLIENAEGGSAGFQRRLGDALSYLLKRKGLTPLWMLIPEISPQRTQAWGRPAIHWHFLALCKGNRYEKTWWLSKEEWLDVYKTAFRWHTQRHEPEDCRASTRCVMARNPARYLSKYLSKTTGEVPNCDYENHQDALPRQWQSRSAPMRKMVEFYTGRLPSSFGEFLDKEYAMLEGLRLGFARHWHPPSCDRYQILTFYPNSFESLMLIWERYISWLGSPVTAPRSDTPDQELSAVSSLGSVQVHQESCEPVVSNGIRPLKALPTPDFEQPNLIKWRFNEPEVVTF